MKRFLYGTILCGIVMALFVGMTTPTFAVDRFANDSDAISDAINEKLGVPIVVLGDTLTDAQKDETRKLLGVDDPSYVDEYTVDGQDIAHYINGNPNSRMFSSAKITREEEGKGLTINIVTPENITEVTSEMYANALLTAGAENATVVVASPVKVTGHSALTGIYKAYDVDGAELDKERMELANDELDVATDLAKKEGMNDEKVTELLAEIKKAIAEQDPATKEDVERIVKEQLDKLEITLSDEDRQLLINLFEKMRELDIDFDQVKDQLDEISSKVKNKLEDLMADEGFWQKVENFFKKIINAISHFMKGILGD